MSRRSRAPVEVAGRSREVSVAYMARAVSGVPRSSSSATSICTGTRMAAAYSAAVCVMDAS